MRRVLRGARSPLLRSRRPTAPATDRIEARYTALARQGRFIRANGIETWPDGTTTPCYQFKHGLYQEVVYARVSAGRRSAAASADRRSARNAGYAAQTQQIAAELAVHFARGRRCQTSRALSPRGRRQCPAAKCLSGGDHSSHAGAGRWSRHFQMPLNVLSMNCAFSRSSAWRSWRPRARRTWTCSAHWRVRARFVTRWRTRPSSFGCWVGCSRFMSCGRSSARRATSPISSASLAEREHDSTLRLVAHWAFGQTLLFQGEFAPAREHLEQGIGLYDRHEHHGLGLRAGFPGDLGVFCHCFAAHTRWHLGYPDQALQHIQQALTLAQELAHPYSRALALAYAAHAVSVSSRNASGANGSGDGDRSLSGTGIRVLPRVGDDHERLGAHCARARRRRSG